MRTKKIKEPEVFPKCRKRTPEEIKENLDELREIIDTNDDPILTRIAYEMETAVRWATEDTADWPNLAQQARGAATMLKSGL